MYYIEYDAQCRSIYNDIINLKLETARDKLQEIPKDHSKNLAYIHLENYLDFFELFISEDKELFEYRKHLKRERITALEKKLSDTDPYKKFILAEIHLQWALTRSKFGELFWSGREVYKAYKLLNENKKTHPDFQLNYKSLSIIHALIETASIPGFIKTIFGMEGSIAQGVKEIEALHNYSLSENHVFTTEAEAIYIYLLFYQANEKEKAFRTYGDFF